MSVYLPISDYIQYGKISQFLAAEANANDALYKGGSLMAGLPMLLNVVRTSVEWQNDFDAADESLNATGLYLYALCGQYIPQAQDIIGSGGGVVIIPGGGSLINLTPWEVEFIVGDDETEPLMVAGETILTISYEGVLNSSVVVYLDGAKLYKGVSTTQRAYTIVYNASDVVITFNQAVSNTNRISVTGLRELLA